MADEITYAEQQYKDVLQLLADYGLDAGINHTGGGCLAIEVALGGDQILLITGANGPLTGERSEQSGWAIGLINDGELDYIDFREVRHSSPDALLEALDSMAVTSGILPSTERGGSLA